MVMAILNNSLTERRETQLVSFLLKLLFASHGVPAFPAHFGESVGGSEMEFSSADHSTFSLW